MEISSKCKGYVSELCGIDRWLWDVDLESNSSIAKDTFFISNGLGMKV